MKITNSLSLLHCTVKVYFKKDHFFANSNIGLSLSYLRAIPHSFSPLLPREQYLS